MPPKRRAPRAWGSQPVGQRTPFKRGRSAPWVPRYPAFAGRKADAGQELKFHDLDIDDATVAAGGTIAEDSCNGIPQGVTESTRVGRKCVITNINWRYDVTIPEQDAAATPLEGDVVRVILYLDKQCNGATATTTGILESDDYQSFNNLANKSRFRILMDRTHTLNVQALASDGAGVVSSPAFILSDSFFKKCSIPIEFDSTAGAITEVRSNNIGVLLVGQTGTAGFASKMRLRFSD